MNKLLFRLFRLPIPWKIRVFISKFLSYIIFPKIKHDVILDKDFSLKSKSLKENGFLIIEDFLSRHQIDIILSELSKYEVFDPWDTTKGVFHPSVPPANTHVGYYKKDDLCKIELFKEISNSPILNAYISNYVGNNFKCTNMASWWTFGNNVSPQEAELFHRDIDNILWLKIFIYLTDVDSNCGPHVFIPESHRKNKFLKFKRFSDAEANLEFGVSTYHVGKAGTLIIEDTFGLHKGQHITTSNNRLIFQLQYSIIDNPLK
jgi:hypothetical protein